MKVIKDNNCINFLPQASIVRSKKDTIHTKAERHILEAVKVNIYRLWLPGAPNVIITLGAQMM